jgi:myo-inositol catabolism protein IolC
MRGRARISGTFYTVVQRAMEALKEQNVVPQWIKLSPSAHQALLEEINKRDGGSHSRIFEILGLRVDIERECPAGGAYMGGEDDKMLR